MTHSKKKRDKYLLKGGTNAGEAFFDAAVEKNIPGTIYHGGVALNDFRKAHESVKGHERRINGKVVRVKPYTRKRARKRR